MSHTRSTATCLKNDPTALAGVPELNRRGRAMTREQKKLLGAVPVAALIVGGLILFKFNRFQAAFNNQEQLDERQGERPLTSNQLNTSVTLQIIPEIEDHLKKLNSAVEKIEAVYPELDADRKKGLEESVSKAVVAVEQRRQHLKQLKTDTLSEPIRDRLNAAETKCHALLGRLNQLQSANPPHTGKDK